jgi:hypothetical protein
LSCSARSTAVELRFNRVREYSSCVDEPSPIARNELPVRCANPKRMPTDLIDLQFGYPYPTDDALLDIANDIRT